MIGPLKPCPWCGESLMHIESLAKSFDPPRIYHEYHHPENGCFMVTGGRHKIVVHFSDNVDTRLQFIEKWNDRSIIRSNE